MKKYLLIAACLYIMLPSCKKDLISVPQGTIDSAELNTPANIDKMVIAAYSSLGNDDIVTSNSLWPEGDLRSGDSHKGGDGLGDNSGWNDYEQFVTNRNDNTYTDQMWYQLYSGIARANDALARVNGISATAYPNKASRQGELHFLRAWWYFKLKILYNRIPYIDETVPKSSYINISNVQYTSDQLWTKIAADFRFAANILPATQTDIGRPNKFTAMAYLAKTLLYQAYTQDASYAVTGIDATKLSEVNILCDSVTASGQYSLDPDFGYNFLTEHDNSPESVFSIQYSINDGTAKGRIDMGHALGYTMNAAYGCCGFHVPSQDMVDAFKTDANGLPMFTGYNIGDPLQGTDFLNYNFDPRLEHTVGIPGNHPFKYEPNLNMDASWARDPAVYGVFASLKDLVAPDDASFEKIAPFMSSSKNWEDMRYADVLLINAEALIELNRESEALPLINDLRTRAGNSLGMLKNAQGGYSTNYLISTYQPGVNCTWTQDYARQALRWERRLELAEEGSRFFDLVRWGIADTYINAYLAVESTKWPYLKTAHFTKGRDEYLPISLNQMNFSKGLYKQNPGY